MSGPFGSSNFFSGTTVAAAYTIDNSCMFDGAADYLSWTPGGAADNADKQTFSFWVKRSGLSANEQIITAPGDIIGFTSGDAFDVQMGSTYDGRITTSALYRDPTAWMHFVYIYDSANAIGDQRMRLFVNGIAVSSFSTQNNPTQNADGFLTAEEHNIGRSQPDSDFYYDGYLAEFIGLDGTAADASSFGEFNSDGVWIPIDPSGLTFGNNGFWLDFEDSSDLGNDVSGNDNDWTSSGLAAANQVLDSPTDSGTTIGNYATWNPLFLNASMDGTATNTYSNGSRTYIGGDAGGGGMPCSTVPMAIGSNSYYVEVTYDVVSAGYQYTGLSFIPTTPAGGWGNIFFYAADDGKLYTESGSSTYGATWGAGDAIGIYYDNDNDELSFYKNGVDQGVAVSSFSNNGSIAHVCCYFGRSTDKATINSGQTAFTGTAPEGALPLCTANLPAPTITKPTDNFLPIVYEGNGEGQRVGNFIPFTDTFAVGASCRFDEPDSDSLTYTPGGAGDTKVGTFSCWMKIGEDAVSINDFVAVFAAGPSATYRTQIGFDNNTNALEFAHVENNVVLTQITTDRYFSFTDTWFNLVVSWDMDDSTASTRIRLYVNGVELTNFSTDTREAAGSTLYFGSTDVHAISQRGAYADNFFDGYMAEVCWVDGTQLTPSSFGETDTSTGRWIPKDPSGLTFGTTGFYLAFASGNDLGDDTSGNTNDFTENNIDTTNGSNQMYDTPSQNFCTGNPNFPKAAGEQNLWVKGNTEIQSTTGNSNAKCTQGIEYNATGKFYWEVQLTLAGNVVYVGIAANNWTRDPSSGTQTLWYRSDTGDAIDEGNTSITYGDAYVNGDIIGVLYDADNDQLTFYNEDVSQGVAFSNIKSRLQFPIFPAASINSTAGTNAWDFNFGAWRYWDGTTTTFDSTAGGYFRNTVPTDAVAVQQDNLLANTAGITGLSWIKNRDAADPHVFQNRISGIYEYLEPNDQTALTTNTNSVQRFLQQGVQIGNMDAVNTSAESFVLWQWANDGSEVTNTDGSISGDSTVRANTTAGFSMVRWSGSGSADTIGHGLGATPSLIIVKNTASASHSWYVYHTSTGNTGATFLNLSSAFAPSSTYWNDTSPTSTVFTVGSNAGTNGTTAADNQYAFCWAAVEGYSAFGSYTGNQDNDGPYVFLGFAPTWVMIKESDAAGSNWHIWDNKRRTYNPNTRDLNADLTNAEGYNAADIDLLGSGFKIRTVGTGTNESGKTYIYVAFAENPFGGSGVAQAKAR